LTLVYHTQNVLIASLSPLRIKLGDICNGESGRRQYRRLITDTYIEMEYRYESPESIGLSPDFTESHPSSVDMWALGMITYQIMTGLIPFSYATGVSAIDMDEDDNSDIGTAGYNDSMNVGDLAAYCHGKMDPFKEVRTLSRIDPSDLFMDFMRSMLDPNLSSRLSAKSALQHQCISGQDSAMGEGSSSRRLVT
jgi:serine/threonine protein kinase